MQVSNLEVLVPKRKKVSNVEVKTVIQNLGIHRWLFVRTAVYSEQGSHPASKHKEAGIC